LNILIPSEKIYSAPSVIQGLGIFARVPIKKDEVIEVCPVIEIPEEELSDLVKTKLLEYYFAWGEDFKSGVLVLGYGSLYNHTYSPNAKYIKELENSQVKFIALKEIKADEEILVNYNGHPEDKTKLWFEARRSKWS
jgi:uncharacterized protein